MTLTTILLPMLGLFGAVFIGLAIARSKKALSPRLFFICIALVVFIVTAMGVFLAPR